MYFKNLSLKKYELKNRDNIKGTLNSKKKTRREAKVVVRATVQFLALMPKVGWVCCSFSPLFQEIFLQVHQFSPLLKNHLSKFKCQVFIRHCGILPLLCRILCKHSVAYDYYFFYSNVEPLSKYSPVMLHLLLLKFLMKILKCDLESTITFN